MSEAVPAICQLSHAGFRMLGEPLFRLSEGARIPSMVIKFEKQETVLPLRSVAREFGIDLESADGKMLDLIEQALDFVVAIKLGDKLPSELNSGEASWSPNELDRRTAGSRVRRNLVRCVYARTGDIDTVSNGDTPGWEDEPKNRPLLQQAIAGAAVILGDTDPAEVIERVAAIIAEVAHIESMRRILTRGIASMSDKLMRHQEQVPISRRDTVKQVQALARRGLREIMSRFDDVDLRLNDVPAMMSDLPAAIAWLRRQRDWFFRTNHAWSPVFAEWAGAPNHFDDFLWKVVERTYLFLAPRFMSFHDWIVKDLRIQKQTSTAQVWSSSASGL